MNTAEMDSTEAQVDPKLDPLSWQNILAANPKAQEGMFNPDRKALLRVGAYVLLSQKTAGSWIPELRISRQIAEAAAKVQGKSVIKLSNNGVRVTIVEIPDSTKADPIGGPIVVEAAGIRATIDSSVFYNCIKGLDACPEFAMSTNSYFVGFNNDNARG